MEIQFNYKGSKYLLLFYPCGNRASVTKEGGMTREIKYDSKTTVKRFLHGIEKMQFNQGKSPIGKNCHRGYNKSINTIYGGIIYGKGN